MAQVQGKRIFGLVLGLAVIGALGFNYGLQHNYIPGFKTVASSVPEKASLKEFDSVAPKVATKSVATASNTPVVLPSNATTSKDLPQVRFTFWAWNAHLNLIYANGGVDTTEGSLMEKYGVRVHMERNDETDQLRDLLLACAKELADGAKDCQKGIHFTSLMGDQMGAQLAAWNKTFRKLGDDLTIEEIGATGRSDGEDGWLVPPEAMAEPKTGLRGLVVAAAPREGDQNIVFYAAARYEVPINVDIKTYDPEAVNFWDAKSYTHASELYNTKVCEKRAEVKNGVRTGKTVNACVNSVTTWTPADVTATVGSKARGGLVKIWSTRQNSSQMPDVILGIKRWNSQHRDVVDKMLAAITEGGEQVRASTTALMKGAQLSATVYTYGQKDPDSDEKDPKFWYKYYLGSTEIDAQGNKVELGGSMAFTLADNVKFFGIGGGTDYNRNTYELFGGYMHKYYPTEVPVLEPYAQVMNKSYLQDVIRMRQEASTAKSTGVVREFKEGERISELGLHENWKIEFQTGQYTFAPSAQAKLDELYRVLQAAPNALVEIHGHTDNVGGESVNWPLSDKRARAVLAALRERDQNAFPDRRVRTIAHGQNDPLPDVDPNSPQGRAKNRRVEVVLGK